MILLLDVGNSRIKWAALQDGKLIRTGSGPHNKYNPRALVGNDWHDLPRPHRVIVSNVAGRAFPGEFDELIKGTWQIRAEYITPAHNAFGVINAYRDPGRLGADRWAALIAARHEFTGALYVVDCGTALTLDMLAANGQHLGGLIIPGFSMMQSALLERTAGISSDPGSSHDNDGAILPNDTREAVHGGGLYAAVAVIDRVIDDVSHALGIENITGVITGGDALLLRPLLKRKYIHEPHLVLKGLAVIAGSDS